MRIRYSYIVKNFTSQVEEVKKLSSFDQDILSVVIGSLESLSVDLHRAGIDNPSLLPDKTIDIIKNVKTHGSLRQRYETINNHSIVLLVSYFSSAVGDLFNAAVDYAVQNYLPLTKKLEKEEIKLSISDLQAYGYDLNGEIGRIIARKSDISFQDMQSISRTFTNFLGVSLDWNEYDFVHNIIAGQACRHAIVHNAEVVDESCVGQLKSAKKRAVALDLKLDDKIVFSDDDVKLVGEAMVNYMSELVLKIENQYHD